MRDVFELELESVLQDVLKLCLQLKTRHLGTSDLLKKYKSERDLNENFIKTR